METIGRLVAAFAAVVAMAVAAPAHAVTIDIRADVDGRSQLILRGNTAQWHHFDFAAPGRELGTNYPTTINGIDWFPIWPDSPTAENRCLDCFSSIFTGVSPGLPLDSTEVVLQVLSVVREDAQFAGQPPGVVRIVQMPDAHNSFTTIIEFDDNAPLGSAFYTVRLTTPDSRPVPEPASLVTTAMGLLGLGVGLRRRRRTRGIASARR